MDVIRVVMQVPGPEDVRDLIDIGDRVKSAIVEFGGKTSVVALKDGSDHDQKRAVDVFLPENADPLAFERAIERRIRGYAVCDIICTPNMLISVRRLALPALV